MASALIIGAIIVAAFLIFALYQVHATMDCEKSGYGPADQRVLPTVTTASGALPITSDTNIPGGEAYAKLADQAFQTDVDSVVHANMFGDDRKPLPEPLSGDQFRWAGEYVMGPQDKYVAGVMGKVPVNAGANNGAMIFSNARAAMRATEGLEIGEVEVDPLGTGADV